MRRIMELVGRQQLHGQSVTGAAANSWKLTDVLPTISSSSQSSSSSSGAIANNPINSPTFSRSSFNSNSAPVNDRIHNSNSSTLLPAPSKSTYQTQSNRFIMTQQRQSTANIPSQMNIDEMFELTYKQIIDGLIDKQHLDKFPLLNDVKHWLRDSMDHNMKNGKRFRAKSLVIAFEKLVPNADEDAIRKACLLGWCVELLQAYFLVVDDIMDHSITRRGQICWYRKENVGMIAINDAIMINNSIYGLLQTNFSSHPHYVQIVDLFNEITRYTAFGQCLDVLSNPVPSDPLSKSETFTNTAADLTTFSDERQSTIVQYKTSYYTFCLPVRLAMYLANIQSPEAHQQAESILLRIGHLFQVQDDYLDCYGDPTVTGKIGTDIEDGKCSWLAVRALEHADDNQRTVLKQFYGLNDPQSIAKIKQLYREMSLQELFLDWEKAQYEEICDLIESIDETETGLSKSIFHQVLQMIYRRQK